MANPVMKSSEAMELSIGELSERTRVKVPTIRYYEKIGLMPPVPRTEGNQRRYGKASVDRLRFIRHSRDLGFEITAIRDLLRMAETPQSSCHDADSIARAHLHDVELRISQLRALQDELTRMIDECTHGRICDCRVISVLADHSQCQSDHHG